MKRKLKLIVWPIIYLVLIINVCVSLVLVFRSYYFKSIFVSGSSMEPTLHGNVSQEVDYGIIDDHKNAIDGIKRFQIITTYYPFHDSTDYKNDYDHLHPENNEINEHDSSYKIKRVYGLPGDTIKFVVDEDKANQAKNSSDYAYSEEVQKLAQEAISFYVKTKDDMDFIRKELKFARKINPQKIMDYADYTYELGDDEYWVMGDNYSASSDCFTKKAPIYYGNIVGVLIAIEGTCKIFSNVTIDPNQDGTKISYKCTNRKRHFPVYY